MLVLQEQKSAVLQSRKKCIFTGALELNQSRWILIVSFNLSLLHQLDARLIVLKSATHIRQSQDHFEPTVQKERSKPLSDKQFEQSFDGDLILINITMRPPVKQFQDKVKAFF